MRSRVLVSLRVAATPDRAFDVFVREIRAWWRPNGLFQFKPGRHGVLALEPGEGRRLTETSPDGTVFEIRFEPAGAETRVTVEHRGWDTVPAAHVARHGFPDAIFLRRHGEWWQALLSSYRSRLG